MSDENGAPGAKKSYGKWASVGTLSAGSVAFLIGYVDRQIDQVHAANRENQSAIVRYIDARDESLNRSLDLYSKQLDRFEVKLDRLDNNVRRMTKNQGE